MVRRGFAVISSVMAFVACSSSGGKSGQDGGAPGAVSVTVAPTSGDVLTCSSVALTATVSGAPTASVTWSVAPSGVGSVRETGTATGTYDAPKSVPTPSTVTVTAASVSDARATASATLTLGTAFPKAPAAIAGAGVDATYGVYTHAVAAKGDRVYAVWPTKNGTDVKLMIARSDDAGATWKPAAAAIATTLQSGQDSIDCGALAIDAVNPDVVYVTARITGVSALATGVGGDGATLVLAVSADGGATFAPTVMQVGGSAGGPHGGWDQVGICGDVASPSANTIVIESPGGYNGDGNPDMVVWSDANRGAGFAKGMTDSNNYLAAGFTDALDNVLGGTTRLGIAENGGTDAAGGATESPQLFTDGHGPLCLTYVGTIPNMPSPSIHTYVQCSSDAGKTFSKPLVVDPATPDDIEHSHPVGALGPNGAAAVAWTQGGLGGANLYIAFSKDAGATFGAPVAVPTYPIPNTNGATPAMTPSLAYDAAGVLWLAYRAYDGGLRNRIVVDKTCDGGASWSGPVLVNGPEGSIADMLVPALVPASGPAPHLLTLATDHLAYTALTR